MNRAERILITGASGFVGRILTSAVRQNLPSSEILGIGRNGQDPTAQGVDYAQMDLASDEALDVVRRFAPTTVYHLAGISSVESAREDAPAAVMANLILSVRLADLIRQVSPGCLFVFAGSGESYGASFAMQSEPLSESAPLQPLGAYARAKTATELSLTDILGGACSLVNLRLFNHTGPGQDERFVAPSFASQIARIEAGLIEPILTVGNLNAVRDFLDVSDVVRAYLKLSERAAEFPIGVNTYNISSGVGISIRQLVEQYLALAACKIELVVDPSRLRASDLPRSVGDSTKFRTQFGWVPLVSFETTLEKTLDFWRSQTRSAAV